MSFHDIVPVLVANLRGWDYAQLSTVDRTTWAMLHDDWKRDPDLCQVPLWAAQIVHPEVAPLGALSYTRHVQGYCDLLTDEHYHPMEISSIEIECSARCELRFYFWEFPQRLHCNGHHRLVFERPLHSTYLLGNVLCTLESESCLVTVRVNVQDDVKAWPRMIAKEKVLESFVHGFSNLHQSDRMQCYWGTADPHFPRKRILRRQ